MSQLEADLLLGGIGAVALALGIGLMVAPRLLRGGRRAESIQRSPSGDPQASYSFAIRTAGVASMAFGALCLVLFILGFSHTLASSAG